MRMSWAITCYTMQNMSTDAHESLAPDVTAGCKETRDISADTAGESSVPPGADRTAPLAMFRDPAWCVAFAVVIALAWFVRGTMLFRGS
ncbi:MAG: hypothetical protein EBR07_07750, partial [Planctomycetes bacterium]|nr:hypothetical protein [Planctomycetota bacterium]